MLLSFKINVVSQSFTLNEESFCNKAPYSIGLDLVADDSDYLNIDDEWIVCSEKTASRHAERRRIDRVTATFFVKKESSLEKSTELLKSRLVVHNWQKRSKRNEQAECTVAFLVELGGVEVLERLLAALSNQDPLPSIVFDVDDDISLSENNVANLGNDDTDQKVDQRGVGEITYSWEPDGSGKVVKTDPKGRFLRNLREVRIYTKKFQVLEADYLRRVDEEESREFELYEAARQKRQPSLEGLTKDERLLRSVEAVQNQLRTVTSVMTSISVTVFIILIWVVFF